MEEKIFKDENFKEYYSNWISCETSLYDIKLLFGAFQENEEEKSVIKTNTKIVMSPQHAKALLGMLKGTIESYEKTFGEINMGPMNK